MSMEPLAACAIVGRHLGPGPGVAEAGDVAGDDPVVCRLQAVESETESLHDTGTEVAEDDVGPGD
jgi:hypothetical protein